MELHTSNYRWVGACPARDQGKRGGTPLLERLDVRAGEQQCVTSIQPATIR
jgi:hypothetical protein